MHIYGAKFQEHCFNISRDIVYSVFYNFWLHTIWRHHRSNLHNRKTSISLKRKKIFQNEKRHPSAFWKAFQISRKYFSCHRHSNWTKPPCRYYTPACLARKKSRNNFATQITSSVRSTSFPGPSALSEACDKVELQGSRRTSEMIDSRLQQFTLNQKYLQKYLSGVLYIWHQKCTSPVVNAKTQISLKRKRLLLKGKSYSNRHQYTLWRIGQAVRN